MRMYVCSLCLMRVHPHERPKMQLSLSSTDPGHVTSHALKAQSGHIYLHAISTDMIFKPKVGHCTAVNENLNVQ
jgi:hypothetical protein